MDCRINSSGCRQMHNKATEGICAAARVSTIVVAIERTTLNAILLPLDKVGRTKGIVEGERRGLEECHWWYRLSRFSRRPKINRS